MLGGYAECRYAYRSVCFFLTEKNLDEIIILLWNKAYGKYVFPAGTNATKLFSLPLTLCYDMLECFTAESLLSLLF
jgi:hypothetical protein